MKIETKYNVGDEIYYVNDCDFKIYIEQIKITFINIKISILEQDIIIHYYTNKKIKNHTFNNTFKTCKLNKHFIFKEKEEALSYMKFFSKSYNIK